MNSAPQQPTRAQVVDAVLDILMHEGPDGVGAIAVARKLGLAPGEPYAFFNDRGEMIDAALDKITRLFLRELLEAERGNPSPLAALRMFTSASAGLIPYITIIPRLLLDGSEAHDQWLKLIRQREAAVHTELARLIGKAQQAGEVRADLLAFKLARYYMGIGFQLYGSWLRGSREDVLEEDSRQLWELFEEVITPLCSRNRAAAAGGPAAERAEKHGIWEDKTKQEPNHV
jgi:AcrR family transcriptional regulator